MTADITFLQTCYDVQESFKAFASIVTFAFTFAIPLTRPYWGQEETGLIASTFSKQQWLCYLFSRRS